MAFSEATGISHDITTDAGFRAWAQQVHDALSAVGMVQTSDTGQINLTTVTTPGTNNTTAGYEIWRFNDSEQATDPIFFKVEYGRGGGASFHRIIVTPGRGSNGSGTITTAASARTLTQGVTPGATGRTTVSFYEGALFLFTAGAPASGTLGYWFLIERLRDETGALVSGQCAVATHSGLGSLFSAGAWNNSPTVYALGASVAASGKIWIGTLRFADLVVAPLRAVCFAPSGVIGGDDTGDLTFNGVSITYKRLNVTQTCQLPFTWAGSGTAHNVLIQNET